MAQDLLLEIGVEELPASFVTHAVAVLPDLVKAELKQLRLEFEDTWASGTPRRLAFIARGVSEVQSDLDEVVMGPSARVAFDAEGKPTKAAASFAAKLGCDVSELTRTTTPKGEYVAGHRRESGKPAFEVLTPMLERICAAIPFRKSMRWGEGETAFGRPARWLLALFGESALTIQFAGLTSGRTTEGHRFLDKAPRPLSVPADYVSELRNRRVIVDIAERKRLMQERLRECAQKLGGTLIDDDFLVEENCNLVEDPQVIAGSFEEGFLMLPERVILNVARGHQRYFGIRSADGRLMPNYLAVVGTAENPDNVRRGNDRVMRARLADAKFFYTTDLEKPLPTRRDQLDDIIFHKRFSKGQSSVGDKVRRLEMLAPKLGELLGLPDSVIGTARDAAGLAKCDLVTLMVGEIPELQGEMGAVYAAAQGFDSGVATVIGEHYQPRSADDATAASDPGALLALADRFDTLVGCFAIGDVPTGSADPLGLRRATLGILRTLFDKNWDLEISRAMSAAYDLHHVALRHVAESDAKKIDKSKVQVPEGKEKTLERLGAFFKDRLRGLLTQPGDVIDACLDVAAGRPLDTRRRAEALALMNLEVRAKVGEVFKRAANIAKEAGEASLRAPSEVCADVHPSELSLYDAWRSLQAQLAAAESRRDYPGSLEAIAEFAPRLDRFFTDVFVMVDELEVRNNRLNLMRDIHRGCSLIANFGLLAGT
jgi:glycyl-tRNA synthetase beta chain